MVPHFKISLYTIKQKLKHFKYRIMKNLFSIILVMAISIAAKANVADSVKHTKGIQSVEILIDKKVRDTTYTRNDTTVIRFGHLKIKVNPKNICVTTDSSKIKKKKPKYIENNWLGLDLGLCGAVGEKFSASTLPANLTYNPFDDLRQTKSINVKLYLLQQRVNLVNHRLNFRWGVGLNWNNYRFNNNLNLYTNNQPHVMYAINDSVKFTKNKWVNKYVTVPLMLELKLGKNDSWKAFRIAAGVEMNLALEAWQKQVSGERGKQKRFEGNYNLAQTPINFAVRLGVGKINFYGTYAITPLFNPSQQSSTISPNVINPQSKFYPWAVGIQLNGL
jgi:hypothetical protein